jgi:hypothetical protein
MLLTARLMFYFMRIKEEGRKNYMGIELLGLGSLTMIDLETGATYDFGECTSLELTQEEWCTNAEPSRTIKGFTNSATFSCESSTIINEELFNELCRPSNSSEFTMEYDTPILIQARWHKKARIRKKWLKRYGYKEDIVKTIARARQGEYNTETGECEIEIDSIQFNFKPYQMCRECMKR